MITKFINIGKLTLLALKIIFNQLIGWTYIQTAQILTSICLNSMKFCTLAWTLTCLHVTWSTLLVLQHGLIQRTSHVKGNGSFTESTEHNLPILINLVESKVVSIQRGWNAEIYWTMKTLCFRQIVFASSGNLLDLNSSVRWQLDVWKTITVV